MLPHTLEVNVPRRGLSVKGDATTLSQVVSNLLNNAAKYTPPGGHITVRAGEADNQVVVRIRDTGIGIAADALPKIFDLFVQERQSLDRANGGLGLGLTIVRNLVERHGGTVSAQSAGREKGSEFVVRLPEAEPVRLEDGRASIQTPSPQATNTTRILVVDDNVDGAEMLAVALSARGPDARVAHDAPQALRVAADFHPAIAFSRDFSPDAM